MAQAWLGAAGAARGVGARSAGAAAVRLAIVLVVLGLPGLHVAAAQPLVRVAIEFRQSGTTSRDTAQGSGRVIITERGSVRPRGRVDVDSRETRTRQSTGIFTLVQSGGESTMLVATEVPHTEIAFFRDYLTGQGYLATGVAFRQVGTSIRVAATALPERRIRVRVTPEVSYVTADGSGAVALTRASTELVVANGQPVVIGGGTSDASAITRRILGVTQSREASETTLVLTATVQ